jgi:serine/threonine protein kinase
MMADSTDFELLQPGETVLNGKCTIEKHLGSGGQGQVYLARHPIFDQVAVKRLHQHIADQAEGIERFKRELRITYQLRGEHVILIHDFDKDLMSGEWFSVMEYANDGNLEDKLATVAPLPIAEAIELTITLCQTLAHVHEYPYVHGDLKPSNVLFHTTPVGKRIWKLSDFGSAFPPVRAGALPLPSGLKTARTRLYVSPELLDASDPEDVEAPTVDVDQRADIYSIGVILYEMLIGRPPFWEPFSETEDPIVRLEQEHVLLRKVKEQLPPEPKSQRSEILSSLNVLIMKALAKDPADRFAGVDEMQVHLKEILQEEKARLAELARLRPLADQALRKEQWGQASDSLYKILDLAPDDPDALQELKIAQAQQQLMNLRHQIPRKMKEELWQEAKTLVEESLEIAPDDDTLTTWQAKIDDQLTIIGILEEAEEAAKEEDWPEVIRLCLRALELDRNHAKTSSLLRQAQTQYKITTLRQEAEILRQQGDKQGELETLKTLQKVVPTDEGVNARIKELQKTIELETYYAQGKQAYDEKSWDLAIQALAEVVAINNFYHDAASMLLEARDQFEKEVSVKLDDQHRQELQKLFDESEKLIESKQWQAARRALRRIHRDKYYQKAIPKEKLLSRVFYVAGRQCAHAEEWYRAKRCFAKALKYAPDYQDAKKQLAIAGSNNLLRRHYSITRTLGSGGTSQIDHAKDMNRGQREVSLKYLKASYAIHEDDKSQRFQRQAQRCMILDHRNIVKILAVEMRGVVEDRRGTHEVDVPVVVMEYVEGQNLAEFLEKTETQGLSERQAINFTGQLCEALQYAHERGILHLDIKPSNTLIQTDGLLKLTDFAHTSHGTMGYRSPEQVRRSADLDERADIFAAGKVLYALLTGKLPVEDPLDEEDPSFQEIKSPLQAVIRKATAPDPTDRYQSAQEMLEALKEAEAALPFWPEFRRQVGHAWQQTVAAAKTWKGVLALIGVLLTFIVLPVLTAEDNTPLGVMLAKVMTSFSGTPTPTPRSIGETKFFVNGVAIEDITQPHYATDSQIDIEVQVRDTDGNLISDDEIWCQWTFRPSLQEQAIEEDDVCKISYQMPEDLESQLVRVVIQGKDTTQVTGRSAKSINIVLKQ